MKMKVEKKVDKKYKIIWEDGTEDMVSERILDILINGVCPPFQSYNVKNMEGWKNISFDFDGVIHSYKSKWISEEIIPDPPVEGIQQELCLLKKKGKNIVINSSRARTETGRKAIQEYMDRNHIPYDYISSVKLPALVYVDDRAMLFDGNTEGLAEKICRFKK